MKGIQSDQVLRTQRECPSYAKSSSFTLSNHTRAQHGLRVTARHISLLWGGDRGQEITKGSFAGEDAYGGLNKNGP